MIWWCFSAEDDESEDDNENNNYDDIEAKLQQERIEYLQTKRQRSELCPVICAFSIPA